MSQTEQIRHKPLLQPLSYKNSGNLCKTFFFPFSFWQHRSTAVCSGNQSSVTTAHPQQWQVQNEKYSRPWLIDFGATREQAVLSLRCEPWALEWNRQKSSLLWDECGKRCCFWSSPVAEKLSVHSQRGCRPTSNFTAEVHLSPYILVVTTII